MIKKLRHKFIIIIMSILFVVFALILGAVNIINFKSNEIQNKSMMNMLAMHDGRPAIRAAAAPWPAQPVSPNKYNIMSVLLDQDNNIINVFSMNNKEEIEDYTQELVTTVLNRNKEYGRVSSYHYLIKDKSYGKIIVLMDSSIEDALNIRLLIISLIIGGVSMFVLFFVSLFLTRMIVKPVEESFRKQRQFISDASHELKTPLSIISVNADVLENETGSSKWLNYIKSETARMSGLVNQLLSIARMDDVKRTLNIVSFNLSEALYQILLPFESTAFEQQKTYTYSIEEAIYYTGEKESIKQVAAVLIDNAIKNTEQGGAIHVLLKHQSAKISLEVYNTGKGIDPSERDKIFERFYSSDYSRSRDNGGYGLGLSIAKAIVDAHHGKINVHSKAGEWAKFTVIL